MLDEKDCPQEDRLLAINCRFPVTELPRQESIQKMVQNKNGINRRIIEDYLDWIPSNNQLIAYTGYGYCDLSIPKTYNYFIDLKDPNKSRPIHTRVIFAIWNGHLPLDKIEHGHKTICVIEFQNGIPNELTGLVGMSEYANTKTSLRFGLCNKDDLELIHKKWISVAKQTL